MKLSVGQTYGGILQVLNKLPQKQGDDHDEYVMDKWVDSQPGYLLATFSAPNLLVNWFRARCEPGIKACVEIDCTYRLMKEGFALAIIGTVDVAQKFHVIAYAILNRENTASFQFILRSVKKHALLAVANMAKKRKKELAASEEKKHAEALHFFSGSESEDEEEEERRDFSQFSQPQDED